MMRFFELASIIGTGLPERAHNASECFAGLRRASAGATGRIRVCDLSFSGVLTVLLATA